MVSPGFFLTGVITLLTFINVLKSEQVLDKQNEDFDFDGLPGVSYEFKVEVNAGDEQCFYQKIAQGARLYVSFEALRGGDRLIDVILRDPNMEILDSQIDQTEGSLEHETTVEGIYTICIDNTASMSRYFYGSKRIYFYMGTYITAEWDKYIEEIEGVHLTVSNFTMKKNGTLDIISDGRVLYTENGITETIYDKNGNWISSDGRVCTENGITETICSYEWDDIDAGFM
ncbi:TMED6 [Mytilus coruscus]|uniref:TMED6 n=1 Tax=Mytilus coruscus TaxID=42192 RepID=A0A6J8BIA3_MYTCO|nr:TMED6 [Mytilus coruscus]